MSQILLQHYWVTVTAGKKNVRRVVGEAAIANMSLFNLAFLFNLKRMKYIASCIFFSLRYLHFSDNGTQHISITKCRYAKDADGVSHNMSNFARLVL